MIPAKWSTSAGIGTAQNKLSHLERRSVANIIKLNVTMSNTTGRVQQLIKEAKSSLNVNGKELADMLGVSRETVSRWESGKMKPSGEFLVMIAVLMNSKLTFVQNEESILS